MTRSKVRLLLGSLALVSVLFTRASTHAQELEAEKELTRKRMLEVYEAIQNYRKDHKELPPSLGALYPKYVSDPKTFLCPTAERTGHVIPFEAIRDPDVETHFGYEFSDRPLGSIWNGGDLKMSHWKQMQMLLVGGKVPMLRCFAYGQDSVFNVTFDGTFMVSELDWENAWNDRLPPGALSPQSLLARVASLLPGNDGDADDWTRLRALSQPEQIYHLADSDGTEAAGARALELSAKIDAFLEKDPAPDQRSEAVQTQRQLLMAAARVGAANADAAWKRAAERERARAGITEDERYRLDADSASFEAIQLFTKGEQKGAAEHFASAMRKLIKEYPAREEPYQMLLSMGRDAAASEKDLAREILDNPNAPENAKATATAILERDRILAAPLDLRFTALDGREVDLTALRGKIVLIDFWATWCGPCIAELPNVIETYRKYRDRGFEIVGISFDTDRGSLEQFVKKAEMPWPQYFDGAGWENKYGKIFGIGAIPTMWLLDHTGLVVDRTARGHDLAERVDRLLAARPTP